MALNREKNSRQSIDSLRHKENVPSVVLRDLEGKLLEFGLAKNVPSK